MEVGIRVWGPNLGLNPKYKKINLLFRKINILFRKIGINIRKIRITRWCSHENRRPNEISVLSPGYDIGSLAWKVKEFWPHSLQQPELYYNLRGRNKELKLSGVQRLTSLVDKPLFKTIFHTKFENEVCFSYPLYTAYKIIKNANSR